jgi:hypothetical protein
MFITALFRELSENLSNSMSNARSLHFGATLTARKMNRLSCASRELSPPSKSPLSEGDLGMRLPVCRCNANAVWFTGGLFESRPPSALASHSFCDQGRVLPTAHDACSGSLNHEDVLRTALPTHKPSFAKTGDYVRAFCCSSHASHIPTTCTLWRDERL